MVRTKNETTSRAANRHVEREREHVLKPPRRSGCGLTRSQHGSLQGLDGIGEKPPEPFRVFGPVPQCLVGAFGMFW